MVTYVNPEVSHYLNSCGVYPGSRLGASGPHMQLFVKRLQKAVCHLAPAAVSRAKNQYFHMLSAFILCLRS
jgi:hypothetical protein